MIHYCVQNWKENVAFRHSSNYKKKKGFRRREFLPTRLTFDPPYICHNIVYISFPCTSLMTNRTIKRLFKLLSVISCKTVIKRQITDKVTYFFFFSIPHCSCLLNFPLKNPLEGRLAGFHLVRRSRFSSWQKSAN